MKCIYTKEISACFYCPNCHQYMCMETQNREIENIFGFPQWCPLDEVTE